MSIRSIEARQTETPGAQVVLSEMAGRVKHWLVEEDVRPDQGEQGLSRRIVGGLSDAGITGGMVGAGERLFSGFSFSHLRDVLIGEPTSVLGMLRGQVNPREFIWAAGASFNSLGLDVAAGLHGVLSAGAFFVGRRIARSVAENIEVRGADGALTSLDERVNWLADHTRLGRFAKFFRTPAVTGISAAIGAGLGDGQLIGTMLEGTRWFPNSETAWQMLTRLGVDPSQILPAIASDMKDAALATFATVLALKTAWTVGKKVVGWAGGKFLDAVTN